MERQKRKPDQIQCAKYRNRIFWIFLIILALYPLRHIRYGGDWWDTGYNYANFMYMDSMDPMWLFGTWLGTRLGNLFTQLPLGDGMLGLNLYTGLMVSALAVGGFLFFTKKVGLPAWITFWGELLAINFCAWCPTALLYNFLTFLLFGAGCVLLYFALCGEAPEKRQRLYFILAGIALGLNVLTRLPNLAETGMIVAVWAMGIIRREKPGRVVVQTLQCLLGYVLGLAAGLLTVCLHYSLSDYVTGIRRLLGMPSEASDYTLYAMVYGQVQGYLGNMKWLGYLLVFLLFMVLLYSVLPTRLNPAKNVLCVLGTAAWFYYLLRKGMYVPQYTNAHSMLQWAALLLTWTLLMAVAVIFGKSFSDKEKLLNGMAVLVIGITPLGSNNGLFSAAGNLFFVLPYTLWMTVRMIRALPVRKVFSRCRIELMPARILTVCVLAMITVQGVAFGLTYVFMEASGGKNMNTAVENNDILRGILVPPDRAELIGSITAYVEEQGLKGQEVILFGGIPSMSYYLEMPFAITAWPDLRSYHYSVMEEDLGRIGEEIDAGTREVPVLLLERMYGLYVETALSGGGEAFLAAGYEQESYEALETNAKLQLISEFAARFGYEKAYENEKFVILLAY